MPVSRTGTRFFVLLLNLFRRNHHRIRTFEKDSFRDEISRRLRFGQIEIFFILDHFCFLVGIVCFGRDKLTIKQIGDQMARLL
ncbi:hypothetical protein MA20_47990 [Bradyrhizobium japonicum]|uniref:Uncharacterized protein n=1 Tax=Bradyrhizobium japonicum TaxID=375 RepID=A0A0A3XEV2_BRAJP|nr:hypothetical protein MA20_47990 [Bradyrhizobium japonicum]